MSLNILRAKDVVKRLGISKTTFYDWQNPNSKRYKSNFPKPIKLGISAVGYLEEEINQFIFNMLEKRDHKEEV